MTNLEISEKYPPVTELATRKGYSFRGEPDANPGETTGSAQDSPIALTDQTNLLPFNKIVVVNLSLGLCILVSSLDSVVVATALPTISETFDAGAVISWVPAGFLLTSTSFQPLYGRFSDIFGRKSALFVTMVVFMIGNLIAGFSKSIVQLIIARGISGAGAGKNLICLIFHTKLDGRICKAGFLACARLSYPI
jgi:MFS family permease